MIPSSTLTELYNRFEKELEKLEDALDDCFEVVNLLTIWQVLNGITERDDEFENMIAQRLSSNFGDEAATTLRSVLFGA